MAQARIKTRRKRRQHRTAFRIHKAKWTDPFPHIPGTEPEKRVFEALLRLKIFFTYQGQIPELLRGLFVTLAIPGYKPDFVLPEYKIIIDPFSPYHHSLPGAAARDARKIGLYTALGYKVYHPWAEADGVFVFDQRSYKVFGQGQQAPMVGRYIGAVAMLQAIPELLAPPKFAGNLTKKQRRLKKYPGYELGPFIGLGATSVAAANRRRTKPGKLGLVVGTRRGTRRGGGSYL